MTPFRLRKQLSLLALFWALTMLAVTFAVMKQLKGYWFLLIPNILGIALGMVRDILRSDPRFNDNTLFYFWFTLLALISVFFLLITPVHGLNS